MLFLFPTCRNEPLTHAYVISGGKKVGKKVEKKVEKIVGKKVEKKVEKKVGKKVEKKVEKKVGKKVGKKSRKMSRKKSGKKSRKVEALTGLRTFATERNGQYIAVCYIFILLSLQGTKYNLAGHSMHGKSLKHVEKHFKPE